MSWPFVAVTFSGATKVSGRRRGHVADDRRCQCAAELWIDILIMRLTRRVEWSCHSATVAVATLSLPSCHFTSQPGVLRQHREWQDELREAAGAAWVENGLVFTQTDGSMIRPDLVSRRFKEVIAQADLPPVRLHDGSRLQLTAPSLSMLSWRRAGPAARAR
jgi:hypothetical protein